MQAFLRGMAQLGWRLGTNFQLDVRWVATDFNRTQALARLVQTQPDVYAGDTNNPSGICIGCLTRWGQVLSKL